MNKKPHDGGAYNNTLPAHIEAAIQQQAGKCPTPDGCGKHGCHGACLPDDECQQPRRNCPACKNADSWGIADKEFCNRCTPTAAGTGTLFVPLNERSHKQPNHSISGGTSAASGS